MLNILLMYNLDSLVPLTLCLVIEKGLSKVSLSRPMEIFSIRFNVSDAANNSWYADMILEGVQRKDWITTSNYQCYFNCTHTDVGYHHVFQSIQFALVSNRFVIFVENKSVRTCQNRKCFENQWKWILNNFLR